MTTKPFDLRSAEDSGLKFEYFDSRANYLFAASLGVKDWVGRDDDSRRCIAALEDRGSECYDINPSPDPDQCCSIPADGEVPFEVSLPLLNGYMDSFLDQLIDSAHCWSHPVWGQQGRVWRKESILLSFYGAQHERLGYPADEELTWPDSPNVTIIPYLEISHSEEIVRNSQLYLDHWQDHPHSEDPAVMARIQGLLRSERMGHPYREWTKSVIYRFHEMVAQEGAVIYRTGSCACETDRLTAYLDGLKEA